MKESIYILEGEQLKRKDNTLYIEKNDENIYLPIKAVYDIHIFTNIKLNNKLLDLCSKENISIHFYSYYGSYIGSFNPKRHHNKSDLLVKQVLHYVDNEKRLEISKKLIESSINSLLYNIDYYNKKVGGMESTRNKIIYYKQSLKSVDNLAGVLGIEANARKCYYTIFDQIIENENFKFEKRSKRPPENRLNSMISFGNSVLYNTVLAKIEKTDLDYRIGYVHTNNNRGYNLNLDIADVFKPIIVDRIIFRLIRQNIIKISEFNIDENSVYLSKPATNKFIVEYDKRLNESISYNGEKVRYGNLINKELTNLKKYLIEEDEYKILDLR